MPTRVVDNARIARAVPGWSAERIAEKTAIDERRYLWELDEERGVALAPTAEAEPASNSDMCELALRRALDSADVDAEALDALFVVTCTPDELNFSHDAMEVHRRLGCRADAFALVVDDGCGGTPYVIDLAQRMIAAGVFRTVAVVGSSFTSPYVHRETFTGEVSPGPGRKPLGAYLSTYVFGDGAGAVVLQASDRPEDADRGILASVARNAHAALVLRRGGGALNPPYQPGGSAADHAFVVDGTEVARSYPLYMRECLEAVLAARPRLAREVCRYYFHQPNKRVMDRFIAEAGLPPERVATNVHRYGNTSAAGMLILLAEDVAEGRVALGSGALVVIAAVGANVHYGAQLVRL